MTNYYFVVTYLPPLSFDAPPEINFDEFNILLKDNLTEEDYKQTRVIRSLYDVLNLRSMWKGEELDPWGNLDKNQLQEALIDQVGLPGYVYDFLIKHEKKEDRIRHFPYLLARFFQEVISRLPEGFLRHYLTFEREWRLVFAAFRAKKLGRDLSVELQYENPEEDLIAQMLAQKDAKTYIPPEKYEDLKIIFDQYSDDPLGLQRALDEYRFNYIESLIADKDTFSFDHVLAYMAQLMIVLRWFEMDKKKGREIVDTIVKEQV